MRVRRFPRCDFPCNPDDLIRVVCFGDAEKMAALLYVTVEQIERWRTGQDAVPYAVYAMLKTQDKPQLGEMWGEWQGFYLDRGRLVSDEYRAAVSLDDVLKLREYRRLDRLVVEQAETIERLIVERDFYRGQCHREAKFGLMLNRLFK